MGKPMDVMSDLFVTCPSCKRRQLVSRWEKNLYVCPVCGKNLPMPGRARLASVFDARSAKEIDAGLESENPLAFPDYEKKLKKAQDKTGLKESALTAVGTIGGIPSTVSVIDSGFLMGSMSSVVGEKITRAVEYATENRTALIIFSASGGARMQEGIYSLMQMAKTADAIEEFSRRGGFYISCLTHPTTGGVTASFASLGDITLAERGALIGFAGPRVIEQTIGKKLPKGFQRSEYLEKHGFVDRIVERSELRRTLIDLLRLHCGEKQGKAM